MDMMKSNPDMLKNMSGMLGENHPMSGYLKDASPEQLQKMMGWMTKLTTLMRYVMMVWNVIKSQRNLIIVLVLAWIIYKFVL